MFNYKFFSRLIFEMYIFQKYIKYISRIKNRKTMERIKATETQKNFKSLHLKFLYMGNLRVS